MKNEFLFTAIKSLVIAQSMIATRTISAQESAPSNSPFNAEQVDQARRVVYGDYDAQRLESRGEFEQALALREELANVANSLYGKDNWRSIDVALKRDHTRRNTRLDAAMLSQAKEIDSHFQQSLAAEQRGDSSTAMREINSAVALAKKTWGSTDIEYLKLAEKQLAILDGHASTSECLEAGESLVTLQKEVYGPIHPRRLSSLLLLLDTCGEANEFEKLVKFGREAKSTFENLGETDNIRRKYLLEVLWMGLASLDKIDEAMEVALEVKKLVQREFGGRSDEMAFCYYMMGSVYAADGKYAQARDTLMDANKLLEETGRTNTNTYLKCRTNLADFELAYGEYACAEKHFKESISLGNLLGSRNAKRSVIHCLNGLAEASEDQKQYAEAGRLLKDALSELEKLGLPNYPGEGFQCALLGFVIQNEMQPQEARHFTDRALKTLSSAKFVSPATKSSVLLYVGKTHLAMGDRVLSEAELIEAKHIRDARLRVGHPLRANADSALADLRVATEEYAAAEPLLRAALASYRESLIEYHPQTLDALKTYEKVLRKLNRTDEADKTKAEYDKRHGAGKEAAAREIANTKM